MYRRCAAVLFVTLLVAGLPATVTAGPPGLHEEGAAPPREASPDSGSKSPGKDSPATSKDAGAPGKDGAAGTATDSSMIESNGKKFSQKHLQIVSYLFVLVAATVLLGILPIIVLLPKNSEKLLPFFGHGQLMQLIVIVVVTGNTATLAIWGLFDSQAVTAIYAGIVGYVLGRHRPPSGRPAQSDDPDSAIELKAALPTGG